MRSPTEPSIRRIGSNILKRKEHHKHVITYSLMLIGQDGLGKTTFANNLLDKPVFLHKYSDSELNFDTADQDKHSGGASVVITKPPKTVLYTDTSNLIDSVEKFDPKTADKTSGVFQLKSTSIDIRSGSKDDDVLSLNILKSSGLGTSFDNEFCFNELTSFLEQQFDSVLAEETRIRRNPKFEDSRIHVALYFIEPNGHGLKELDIVTMKKLSKYTNVLPIISRSDSFTVDELKQFKSRVLSDLEYYNVPIYKFVTNDDFIEEEEEEEEDVYSNTSSSGSRSKIASDEHDEETLEDNQLLDSLQPFAVICSDVKDKKTGHYYRKYPWADTIIDIDDTNTSDLSILKRVLFGSHLQDFKDTMANFLYENYRAGKLSNAINGSNNVHSGTSDKSYSLTSNGSSVNINNQINTSSTTPSLSNFQKLVINGEPSTYSLDRLARQVDANESELHGDGEVFVDAAETTNSVASDERNSVPSSPSSSEHMNYSANLRKSQLRNISNTVPYQLKRDRIKAQKQKLEELETNSAKELQKRIEELEKKAAELKKRERMLKIQRESHKKAQGASAETAAAPSIKVKTEQKYIETITSVVEVKQEQSEVFIKPEHTLETELDTASAGNISVVKTDVSEGI